MILPLHRPRDGAITILCSVIRLLSAIEFIMSSVLKVFQEMITTAIFMIEVIKFRELCQEDFIIGIMILV